MGGGGIILKTRAQAVRNILLVLGIAFLLVFTYLAFALPSVTYISPTLQDNATTGSNWVFINLTSSEPLNQSLLEWGNASGFTNVSMSNSSMTNWYKNMTNLADYTYNYTVWAENTTGEWNQTGRRFVVVDTVQPYSLIACQDLTIANSTYILTQNVSSAGACFNILANNVTLDGAGFTVNYSQATTGYGVNITSRNNVTVKNLNIVQGNSSVSSAYGIYGKTMENSTIFNNTINTATQHGIYFDTSGSNNLTSNNITTTTGYGIYFYTASTLNLISGNTISTSGSTAYGIDIRISNSNTLQNNIISTSNSNAHALYIYSSNTNIITNNTLNASGNANGIYLWLSNSNNITGGSIISKVASDYLLRDTGSTNNFRDTNFTAGRNIYFSDNSSWFNYNNQTSGNIWLKTNVSAANTLTRTLVTWSNTSMKWNDTNSTSGIIANYNITGLQAATQYKVYNTSGGTQTNPYTLTTDSVGRINFNISLNGNTEIIVNTTGGAGSSPTVLLNSPINNFNQTSASINFNCTAWDDLNLTNVTLYNNLNGTWAMNGTNSSGINNTAYIFDRVAPSNGTFTWNCLSYNNASLSSFASQNFTVTVDGVPPTSNSPPNASYSQNSSATIGWILYDNYAGGYYTTYRNGAVQNQSTWQNNTNLNVWVNTSVQGTWNYTITYNDSIGNNGIPNTVWINITADTTSPTITFVSPTWDNNTNRSENWEYVNITLNENGNVSLLEWNNGTLANYTMQGSGTNFYRNMTNQNGTITYRVYANDTAGNMNVSGTMIVTLNYTTGQNLDNDLNTLWVRTDGNDACSGQNNMSYAQNSTDCAWLTISKGISTIDAGQTLRIQSGTYQQDTNASFTKQSNNSYPMVIVGDGNPIIQGNGSSVGIVLQVAALPPKNTSDVYFSNFTMRNYTTAIKVLSAGESYWAKNISFNNIHIETVDTGFDIREQGAPTDYSAVQNITVSNSEVAYFTGNGIYFINVLEPHIRNNVIRNSNAYGGGISGYPTRNGEVENNNVENITHDGYLTFHAYTFAVNTRNMLVKNNTVRNVTGRGIRFDNSGSNNTIIFNTLDRVADMGFDIYRNHTNLNISFNTILNSASAVIYDPQMVMDSNTYVGSTITFYGWGDSSNSWYSVISNNTFTNTPSSYSITFVGNSYSDIPDNVSHTVIKNNIFSGTKGISQQTPIDNMAIKNNVFYNISGTAIRLIDSSNPNVTASDINFTNNVCLNVTSCVGDMRNASVNTKVSFNIVFYNSSNAWVNVSDTNALYADPLFANASAGDFHLKSQAGRWNGTGWVTDSQTSPAIDAGDPSDDYSLEPQPNGNRINLGAYGNTGEASKSMGGGVLVTLNSPQNSLLTSNATLTFNCSASSSNSLVNISLYGNWSGWSQKNSTNITGTSNSSQWVNTLADGTYLWNCKAYDSTGNSSFAASNYTLTVDTIPPMSVTNLLNQSQGETWIYWNWTNPAIDFNHSEIYLNGTWKTNTSLNYYNATDLNASTWYQIQTRTVDNAGNINTTWINSTARTLSMILNITSWSNNKTNDQSLTITINVGEGLNINATANQSIDTWTWKKDGTDQNWNYDNISLSWDKSGRRSVSVNGSNANGGTQQINWTVEVRSNISNRYDTIADTYIIYDSCTNHGNELVLKLFNDPSGNYKASFFNFLNISGLTNIENASFNFFVTSIISFKNIYVYRNMASWNESGLTDCEHPFALYEFQFTPNVGWNSIDFTDIVNNWNNGTNEQYGIYFILPPSGEEYLASRENFTLNASYIQITPDTTKPTLTYVNITPNNTQTNSSWAYINITSSESLSTALLEWNGTAPNLTMSGSSTNWYLNKTGLSNGNYTFKVYANDSANNWNVTETRWVYINYTSGYPQYSNISVNTTQRNNPTLFTAYWNDDIGLSAYIFSTNNSGTWANYSSNFSGTGNWSNYTITLNSTIGLAIGYIFYANNTNGNWNSTAINTLTTGCLESWSYSDWSACSGGTQTRTASDSNSCGTTINRSALSQSCSSGTTPSGGGGGGATVTLTKTIIITPNESVKKVTVNLKIAVENPSLTITKLTAITVTPPAEPVYQYLNITKSRFNDSQIDNATIEFRVNKSWITGNNFTKVYLARYDNGWTKLKTELVNSTDTVDYYIAYTNGFSYFAIVGEVKAMEAPVCSENWSCTEWSACENDKQSRICRDLSNCNATAGKPEESRGCKAEKPMELPVVYITIAVVGIAAILFGILYFAMPKKRREAGRKR